MNKQTIILPVISPMNSWVKKKLQYIYTGLNLAFWYNIGIREYMLIEASQKEKDKSEHNLWKKWTKWLDNNNKN